MSMHQTKDNFVVVDQNDNIVEAPTTREAAEQKKQLAEQSGDKNLQEGLKVKQLLTE